MVDKSRGRKQSDVGEKHGKIQSRKSVKHRELLEIVWVSAKKKKKNNQNQAYFCSTIHTSRDFWDGWDRLSLKPL